IIVAKNTPVKATADGTVIFAEWTTETGYVVIIEHSHELISVYKHNASLTKEQGDLVKAGEVIAMAGSTGEYSTGPHLHFELWSRGYPINPTNFIDFNLMFSLKSALAKPFAKTVRKSVLKWANNPVETQEKVFQHLISEA